MYQVERAKDGWKVKSGEKLICFVPTEQEAQKVAAILRRDYECRLERVA